MSTFDQISSDRELKNMKKYCCDPFKEHSGRKMKDPRLITKVLAKKFDAVRGISKFSNEELSYEDDDADDKAGQIVEKLKERFHTAESRSEKIVVSTIFRQTWSRRKMMLEFGCSQRMATQAKHLAIQKGILATPNPKAGKRLATETISSIETFYRHDDISRVMPGKKDSISILRDGANMNVQKRLVLGNLKEIYQISNLKKSQISKLLLSGQWSVVKKALLLDP